MTEGPDIGKVREPGAPLWVISLLQVLAVLVILMTLLWAVFQVVAYTKESGRVQSLQVVVLVAGFVFGLSGGALLLALATMFRYWHTGTRSLLKVEQSIERMLADFQAKPATVSETQAASISPAPRTGAAAEPIVDTQALQTILALLGDIRDNTLLNEEQRRAKLERLMVEHRRNQVALVETMVAQNKFLRAEHILQELVRRFGPDAEFERLAAGIAEARARLEKQQTDAARKKLTDLLSINAWDRAEEVVADLLQHQPSSTEARELAEHVQTEKNRFQEQQRARLFAEIEKHTLRKEWQAALQAAQLLLRLYPDGTEAETLKPRIATLEANAEIAVRQTMEAQIKDLIRQQRFAEAVEIAERLVRQYPASPQAEALRDQLPKLRAKVVEFGPPTPA